MVWVVEPLLVCDTDTHQGKQELFTWLYAHAAAAAADGEVPVAACITRGTSVLWVAVNAKEGLQTPVGHAELLVLDRVARECHDWRLTGCELWCTMEPCVMCVGALLQTRIMNVHYLVADARFGACGSVHTLHSENGLNHQFRTYEYSEEFPDMTAQYIALLQNFFQTLRCQKKSS